MTDEIRTGGPAFPLDRTSQYSVDGMTQRDYFAGQALPGVIMACREDRTEGSSYEHHCATRAYRMADAMLAVKYATDPKFTDDDLPF